MIAAWAHVCLHVCMNSLMILIFHWVCGLNHSFRSHKLSVSLCNTYISLLAYGERYTDGGWLTQTSFQVGNSEIWRPRNTPLRVMFRAQQGSCLFIQRRWLLLSAASDAALMAERGLWPLTLRSLSNLEVHVATKLLHPAPTGWTIVFQPKCSASAACST